jgi:diacylglycerol kinase (ATP)
MKPKHWWESVNCAIEGVLWAATSQKHLRWHFLTAIAVMLLALLLKLSALDFILLSFAVTLVLFAEIVNTAIEVVVDLVSPEFHPLAKRAKDVAAGSVLVASFGAVVMGFFVFAHYLFPPAEGQLNELPPIGPVVPVVALVVVVMAVVLLKARFGGRPLQGGMPSGHAAVAFSVAVSVLLGQPGLVVALLVLLIAFLVANSRVLLGVHSVGEVVAGAAVGILITLILYWIF